MEQEKLNEIAGYVSKLLRKNFGRGPGSCQCAAAGRHLIVHIRGFISPMEEVLLREGSRSQVEKARNVIIEHLISEMEGVFRVMLEREVRDYYHDWNFPNNSGMLMFELDGELGAGPPAGFDVRELEREVARISQLTEKIPDRTNTYVISQRYVLLERNGILIAIEKALYKKGYGFELKTTKDELEKSYFHRQGRFDPICNARVLDIFVSWNFKEDKSLMAFVLDV